MVPIWGRQGPGGPHVGRMNFAISGIIVFFLFFFMNPDDKFASVNLLRSSHAI